MNQTTVVPFYYSPNPSLINGVSDVHLTVFAPTAAYWSLSLLFHWMDISDWKWLAKYRIHESAEVKAKNLVSKSQVVWAVIFQQIVQTILGYMWISEPHGVDVNHAAKMARIAVTIKPWVAEGLPVSINDLSYFIYWWFIPVIQLLFGMFFIDTWQYFWHRLMHENKYLYRQIHSWHHRLYVPYAFGSLYNHPVEGFIFDSLGTALAEAVCGMTTRQAMLLFSVASLKTVDDHCGYRLPWDPLQFLASNNADYHDIHHQIVGIKSNFSQPFFIHWDVLLGTRMTRAEMEARKKKSNAKLQ